jgi:hypothetical protein
MTRSIILLGLSALLVQGCTDQEAALGPASESHHPIVDPAARRLSGSGLGTPPYASLVSPDGLATVADGCSTITFEGMEELTSVGTPAEFPGATFGSSWVAVIDRDDGGLGFIANEPSGVTVAFQWDPWDTDIVLTDPAHRVSVLYSAASSSLPLGLVGLDGSNQVIASASGTTVGASFDGAVCTGDPGAGYCLWELLEITTPTAVIETIRIEGYPGSFGIDNLTVCTGSNEEGPGDEVDLHVDIKPDSEENTVNLGASGKLPVAVYGTEFLDPETLEVESITLGDGADPETSVARKGGDRPMAQIVDLNEDGISDLLLHFDVAELVSNGDLTPETTELLLEASRASAEVGTATVLSGTDVVTVVGGAKE